MKMFVALCLTFFITLSFEAVPSETITPISIQGVGDFYRTSPGTVAFIPFADSRSDAERAVQFRILPQSGAYRFRRQS